MARRAVNIATISEEDVMGEEVGEDGMVETIAPNRLSGERDLADEIDLWKVCLREKREGEERPDSERRSSLIEREVDGGGNVSNSILKAISSLEGPSSRTLSLSRSRSSESLSYSTFPRAQQGLGATSSSASVRRKGSWRASRGSGTTMNLSGKFVTELTMYDPLAGPVKTSCINLGMFVATDQTMGDHFIYKMSAVSPLTALKLQQQDRLLKVNDISVVGWSHNCLVEFIRGLSLSSASEIQDSSKETTFEIPLCMELRKSGKAIRSAEESPSSKRVAATLRIKKNRASVVSVHETFVRVKYSTSNIVCIKLASVEDDLYLKTSISLNNTVTLQVGRQLTQDDLVYFRLHYYDVSPAKKGKGDVVLIEAPGGSGYLQGHSLEALSVMSLTTPPSSLLQIDVRFFHISNVPGSSHFRIQNIHTGHYLSATSEGVSLVGLNDDLTLPEETRFDILRVE